MFDKSVDDDLLRPMMDFLGYDDENYLLGNLKRPQLRREWSFFYDCITRAFANKSSDIDAIQILSQQIGYFLIYNHATSIPRSISDRIEEDENTIYYARFCQLIFSSCFPAVAIFENETIPQFQLTKRAFKD